MTSRVCQGWLGKGRSVNKGQGTVYDNYNITPNPDKIATYKYKDQNTLKMHYNNEKINIFSTFLKHCKTHLKGFQGILLGKMMRLSV